MKRVGVVILLGFLVVVVAGASLIFAQQQPTTQRQEKETPSPAKIKSSSQATMEPTPVREKPRRARARRPRMRMNPERMQMMMERMGIDHTTIDQCKMIMRTPIYLDSPECLYARSEELGLSKEQKQALKKIAEEAREKALKVLTPEQLKSLDKTTPTPMSVVDLCGKMLKQAREKTRREYTPMIIAPLIAGLLEAEEPAVPPEKEEKEK
ncbi:hypothetical protein J7M23_05325 [Candidatus Sumerlaeota bacterium]|nr:hypothetical protein [Candidatus Sumerlaeota bacterium]